VVAVERHEVLVAEARGGSDSLGSLFGQGRTVTAETGSEDARGMRCGGGRGAAVAGSRVDFGVGIAFSSKVLQARKAQSVVVIGVRTAEMERQC
jgi:hypothetical protein